MSFQHIPDFHRIILQDKKFVSILETIILHIYIMYYLCIIVLKMLMYDF